MPPESRRRTRWRSQGERLRAASSQAALDQAFAQSAPAAQPPLEPPHPAIILFVIIAKKVQQAMQRQDPEFGAERVAGGSRLPPRNSQRNHHIAELAGLPGRE